MSKSAPQRAFAFGVSRSYAPEDFIVCASNEEAVNAFDNWPQGNAAMLLSGPVASGKTHLAHRFLAQHEGVLLDKAQLGKVTSEELMQGNACAALEDIHAVTDEQTLFHLLRHAETQGCRLLLTAREPAQALRVTLPDLRSRLVALPSACLHAPDEELLRLFLRKGFADHQLRVGEDVIEYLLRRMERSFAAALQLIETIERASLESRREITVPWVKTVL